MKDPLDNGRTQEMFPEIPAALNTAIVVAQTYWDLTGGRGSREAVLAHVISNRFEQATQKERYSKVDAENAVKYVVDHVSLTVLLGGEQAGPQAIVVTPVAEPVAHVENADASVQTDVTVVHEPIVNPTLTTDAAIVQPAASLVLPEFGKIAEPLAKMGVPMTPVRPMKKKAFLPNFPETATTNLDQIHAWDKQYPGHNAACVARAEEGGVWFFEVDSRDVLERIKKDTGHDLRAEVPTFSVRSRPGRGHMYWRHTPWTIANLPNISQTYVIGGDWSVRTHHEYVVAPGSVHPTGSMYEAIDWSTPIAEAPQWLLDWLLFQKVEKSKTASASAGDNAPRNENGKVPHGSIHGWLLTRAGKLRAQGLTQEEIETVLLRQAHEECQEPLDDEKIKAMAKSICSYEAGKDNSLILNQPAAQPAHDDEPEEQMDDTETIVFPEFPVFPGALTDLSKALFPSIPLAAKIWILVTYWGLMRSGLDTFGVEKHLQPRFYSVLIMPKWSGKSAALNEVRTAWERIETAIAMNLGTNDSVTCSKVNTLPSADTGQYLVAKFAQLAKEKANDKVVCHDLSVKALLDCDEAADFFEKGRTSPGRVSTLFIEMLKLYAGNRTGNGTKTGLKKGEDKPIDNAHFAVVSGTQNKKYPQLWVGTGAGNDGVRSRFTQIGLNAPEMPAFQEPSDEVAVQAAINRLARLAQLPGQNIRLTEDAIAVLNQWWTSIDKKKDSVARVLDIVKQFLIVLTVVNLPEGHAGDVAWAGQELVEWGTRFGDFLIAVRDRVDPNDSWSQVQAMENDIIGWLKQNASKKDPKSQNDCRRGVHPQRKPGGLGAFNQAWKNAWVAGVVKARKQNQRGNLYSL